MIVVLKSSSTDEDLEKIVEAIKNYGYTAEVVKGKSKTIIGAVGDQKEKQQHMNLLGQLHGVEAVVPIMQPHKLGSREFRNDDSSFEVGNTTVGGSKITLIAGPCSIESEDQSSIKGKTHVIKKAVKIINNSKKTVIIAGGGIKSKPSS